MRLVYLADNVSYLPRLAEWHFAEFGSAASRPGYCLGIDWEGRTGGRGDGLG